MEYRLLTVAGIAALASLPSSHVIAQNATTYQRKDIEVAVKDVAAELFGIDKAKIALKSHLQKDLGMDSLDAVEFIMELEKKFDISIPDAIAEKATTIQTTIEAVEKCLRNRK